MTGFASAVLVEPSLSHLDRAFTYIAHPGASIGDHVRVPFRGRNRRAVVVALLDEPDVDNPLDVAAVLGPGLPLELVDLARWLSERYLSTLGEALAAVLPGRVASEEGSAFDPAPAPQHVPPPFDLPASHQGIVWRPGAGTHATGLVDLCGSVGSSGRGVLCVLPEVRAQTEVASALR
ncbi:MAG: hypothetical protein ABR552_05360, partial [Actinomycetota bacterium]